MLSLDKWLQMQLLTSLIADVTTLDTFTMRKECVM
jgi:hypothetical protein